MKTLSLENFLLLKGQHRSNISLTGLKIEIDSDFLKSLSPAERSKASYHIQEYLKSIQELDLKTAQYLAKNRIGNDNLELDALEKLSPQGAKYLAMSSAKSISMKNLQRVSLESLNEFSNYKGTLILGGLKTLNLKQAQVITKFKANAVIFES